FDPFTGPLIAWPFSPFDMDPSHLGLVRLFVHFCLLRKDRANWPLCPVFPKSRIERAWAKRSVCPTLAPRRAWRLLGKWLRSHVGRAILSSYLPNPRLSGSSISLCGAVAYSYKTRVNTPHKTRHATTKTSRIPQIMSCKFNP